MTRTRQNPWLRWYLAASCALAVLLGISGLITGPGTLERIIVPLVAAVGGVGTAWAARRWTPRLPALSFSVTLTGAAVTRVIREYHIQGAIGTALEAMGLIVMLAGIAVGMAAMPTSRPSVPEALRAVLDGFLVATAFMAFLWRFNFTDLAAAVPVHVVASLATDALAVGFALVILVRDVDRPIRVGAVALAGIALSDAANSVHLSHHGTTAWWEPAAKCIFFALVTYCIASASYAPPRLTLLAQQHLETRRITLLSTVTYSLVAADLAHMVFGGPLDAIDISCVFLFVITMWAQEVVRSRQALHHARLLADQAILDPLTRLRNRNGLADTIARLDGGAGQPVCAFTIDLDGFKNVNDQHGQSAGDKVLATVGTALRQVADSWQADVYRLGADEFLCLARVEPQRADHLAQELVDAVKQAASTLPELGRVSVSASVGMAQGQFTDDDPQAVVAELISLSGHAMRSAKRTGRGRIVVHDSELAQQQLRASRVEARLRLLLSEGGSPQVHYQPLMSLRQDTVAGVEALARWTDDELGFVSPLEFIGIAEKTGLISELGTRVLQQAIGELTTTDFFERGMHLAVNVSPIQLRQPDFAERTLALLAAAGLSPDALVLEITESVAVSETDPALAALVQLSEAGVGLAIDDFGSGYASIGYLQQLPVSILKLDRSLSPADANPRTDSIVKAVVELARGMNLDIIMEGVETTEQAQRAASFGIGFAQGWLYAKAVPLGRLGETIAELSSDTGLPDWTAPGAALPHQTNRTRAAEADRTATPSP